LGLEWLNVSEVVNDVDVVCNAWARTRLGLHGLGQKEIDELTRVLGEE
jgi:hypothetical protein